MRITPAVKVILITAFVSFLLQQTIDKFFGGSVLTFFGLVPYDVVLRLRFWQIFTYPFLHGDVLHLVFNLLMLVMIGSELEALWKTPLFLRFYFFCTTSAAFFYLLIQLLLKNNSSLFVPMVGASGGIFGMLVAYGILFGERMMLFMLIFPMKAKHFIWILAGIEFMTTVFSGSNGLAGVAHLGGMFGGFLYLWGKALWIVTKRRKQQQQIEKGKRKNTKDIKHLKLVIDNDKKKSKDDSDFSGGGGSNPTTWH